MCIVYVYVYLLRNIIILKLLFDKDIAIISVSVFLSVHTFPQHYISSILKKYLYGRSMSYIYH